MISRDAQISPPFKGKLAAGKKTFLLSAALNPQKGLKRVLYLLILVTCSFPSLAQNYFANGTAKNMGGDCYQLTNSVNWENGSVWYSDKIDLQNDFDLEFYMNFGSKDGGADGIVFVVQNKGNKALGQAGGGLGYEGFSPSFGVEFDDFQNTSVNDPVSDHIGVFRDGNIDHNSLKSLYRPVDAIAGGGNIEDGKNHLVRMVWEAKSKSFEVYFDCEKRVSLRYDIQKNIFNGERYVYWGFTAATGGLNNRQTVCLRKDILSDDTVSLCKGSRVRLNSRESFDNTYTWSPSADLDDATVKQPWCSTEVQRTYIVNFKNLCGELEQDTVVVLVDEPFTMDVVQDSLLCDGRLYHVDMRIGYDSVRWSDGFRTYERWLRDSGYYKVRAWKGTCWDDDSLLVSTDRIPIFTIVGDSVFCQGDSTRLLLDLKSEKANILWHTGETDTAVVLYSTQMSRVNTTNECGSWEDSFAVREIILPRIEITGDQVYCEGDSASLFVQNTAGFIPAWNDGFRGASRSVDSGWYKAIISDHHCIAADSFIVQFKPKPFASVVEPDLLCEFEELILSHYQEGSQNRWSNGSVDTTADYTLESGPHWLVSHNECGEDSVSFFIERRECTCDMLVPNAFSPNGDIFNAGFAPVPDCDKLLRLDLKIYNLWGQELYHSTELNESWDGTYKGTPVQAGVYIWHLEYSGIDGANVVRRKKSGTVTLIR